MSAWPQPVKLWYWGPTFRYDRPQKGRYRQFSQLGFEIFGESSPTADAFTVMLVWQIMILLSIQNNLVFDINTIGDKSCRPKLYRSLGEYFTKHKQQLCPDCQRRLEANPLRILDCKELSCEKVINEAPSIIDLVCEACKEHFKLVLEHLDDLNIPYDLNPRLVRGLDYYTRTTFEVRTKSDERRQASLGGGGRYDELVQLMGGQPTPAVGYAGGVERMIEYLIEMGVKTPDERKPEICVVQFGQLAKRKSLVVMSRLVQLGYPAIAAFDKDSLNAQLKYADKMKVKVSIIIGQKEALSDEVIIRDMEDGSQVTIPVTQLDEVLKKKVKRGN
jgi:histidyl-tRNA synthetase